MDFIHCHRQLFRLHALRLEKERKRLLRRLFLSAMDKKFILLQSKMRGNTKSSIFRTFLRKSRGFHKFETLWRERAYVHGV